jgi:hypothetical protein
MLNFFKLASFALIGQKLWIIIKPQHSQDSYLHRFMKYMLVGLCFFLLVFLFRNSAVLKGIENEGIDILMQFRQ